ncbi:tumor necrosis factor ligand superfamily member 10-like [Melopsittacus undulatus]|uniref:tumor necrosis factor ligand superfamily member 10-like n=1 Tax=Melopsittacus undulatus TaxID=13146 RepID=UPI00146ED6AA|nr:tumor necrosis factor ligand superfamily member 10-like [Melopsittacus undulatus]
MVRSAVPAAPSERRGHGRAMTPHQPSAGQYLRSDSGGSEAPMLADGSGPGPGPCPGPSPGALRRRRRCGPLWSSVAVMAILALQIACTTGLFVYFTMAISKLKAQAPGNVEELRCLQVINQQQEGSSLEELISNQSCLKLANTIKAYVATVMENMIRRSVVKEAQRSNFNTSEGQVPPQTSGKPSAHLTLRPQSLAQDGNSRRFGNLSQSCRHAIARWEDSTIHSHLQNITYQDGRLRVNQAGKYYVYSQIYFRYASDVAGTQGSVPQLVQCINWKTSYSQPILLLKGVGTKCWAPEADYGLHALYQGGLFELKAGDELFVSVSSLAIDYNDAAASYFGAFRLDL